MFSAPFGILLGLSVVSAWDSQIAGAGEGEGMEPPDVTYPRILPHLFGKDRPHYPFPFGKTEPEVLIILVVQLRDTSQLVNVFPCEAE